MPRFVDLLRAALTEQCPFALGIVSRTRGSSPQKSGAKAIFFADGRILGTLGGGCLEAEIQDRARRALQTGEPTTFDMVLDHDFGWDDGLICGGTVNGLILPGAGNARSTWEALIAADGALGWGVREDFSIGISDSVSETGWRFVERVIPQCELWIAGSGHVAQAVAPLALQLEFAVTVFDDRPALANHERFPHAVRLETGAWEGILKRSLPAHFVLGLIVTRGHQHDALVLRHWIREPFAFLGMIGSRRKRRIIFDQFVADGLATAEDLERVACPVGVDIGAVSVEEIAVSIVAEMVRQRALTRCGRSTTGLAVCS